MFWIYLGLGVVGILVIVTVHDLVQKKHAILRNFPVIGHFRYLLESIGPELRQYIVTDNNEERPFSRDQRRWVYANSKGENSYFGFGTDNEMELSPNYLVIKHSAFPVVSPAKGSPEYDPEYLIPCAKVLGGHRNRKKAFRPDSFIYISGMSFGSLSAQAIEALNRGCKIARCLHSTGEGGVSPYHLHGGDLIWQIGTGYFGCRDLDGHFDEKRLIDTIQKYPHIKAIEVKLSQGAKPGAGGLLPKVKISKEIADIRGIPRDRDCISPAAHTAFSDADGLLDFVERIADLSGLPVGLKSAVGQMNFWEDLTTLMTQSDRAVDFVIIDGGEGGTGAGPLVFTDHVAMPFKRGFAQVYKSFYGKGLADQVVFGGSGKLGFSESALFASALGCDLIAIAREPMMAIGCIQAQRCHSNHCPTGVATQNKWLVRGLDPALKSARLANYLVALRKDLLLLCRTCGVPHPALVSPDFLELMDGRFAANTISEVFGYWDECGLPGPEIREEITRVMSQLKPAQLHT